MHGKVFSVCVAYAYTINIFPASLHKFNTYNIIVVYLLHARVDKFFSGLILGLYMLS